MGEGHSRAPLTPLLRNNDVFLKKSFALYEFLKFFQGLQVFFWTLSYEQKPDKQMRASYYTALLEATDKRLPRTRVFKLEYMGARQEKNLEQT